MVNTSKGTELITMDERSGPDGLTTGEYIIQTRTILNEHLVACEKSNTLHTRILITGMSAIVAVAGFGLKTLYDNVTAQANQLEATMTQLTTRDRIITTTPDGRTVTRAEPIKGRE